MSAAARKMMEKMGWREGEGLGKEKDGVKSYLKVVRRDAHTATGLGHMADPTQGGSLASTHAVELDGVYSSLLQSRNGRTQRRRPRADDDEDDSEPGTPTSSSSSSATPSLATRPSGAAEGTATTASAPATRKARKKETDVPPLASSSSSEQDDDDDDDSEAPVPSRGDVTRMSDADLFARCGGVRLGRAGRHRFFDGKLSRIATSNASSPTSPSGDKRDTSEKAG